MKKFLIAVGLVLSSVSAMAVTCNAEMVARNGRVIDRFSSYDYSYDQACREALRECRYEKQRRSYDVVVQRATCEVERRNPNPVPRKEVCSFNLVNSNNGRIVDTFTAQGQNEIQACKKADDKCFDARYTKANPWKFSCEKVRGGGYDPRPRPNPTVTRFCTVDRIGNTRYGGRVLQSYTASATGVQGSGVLARACQKAASDCSIDSRYSGQRDACVQRRQ